MLLFLVFLTRKVGCTIYPSTNISYKGVICCVTGLNSTYLWVLSLISAGFPILMRKVSGFYIRNRSIYGSYLYFL